MLRPGNRRPNAMITRQRHHYVAQPTVNMLIQKSEKMIQIQVNRVNHRALFRRIRPHFMPQNIRR